MTGGFAGVYPVLAALEERGAARRGYFVEGLGAAQFAVPGAVDRLRAIADRSDRVEAVEEPPGRGRPGGGGVALVLAATDPANPYGAALPWPERVVDPARATRPATGHRPGRKAGALVVPGRRRPGPLRRTRRPHPAVLHRRHGRARRGRQGPGRRGPQRSAGRDVGRTRRRRRRPRLAAARRPDLGRLPGHPARPAPARLTASERVVRAQHEAAGRARPGWAVGAGRLLGAFSDQETYGAGRCAEPAAVRSRPQCGAGRSAGPAAVRALGGAAPGPAAVRASAGRSAGPCRALYGPVSSPGRVLVRLPASISCGVGLRTDRPFRQAAGHDPPLPDHRRSTAVPQANRRASLPMHHALRRHSPVAMFAGISRTAGAWRGRLLWAEPLSLGWDTPPP